MSEFLTPDGEPNEGVNPSTYLKTGDVLVSPEGADPSGMHVSALRFKGYVEVWDTVTGDKSLQPWWLMWQTMNKRRPDGTLVFTRTDPHIAPNHGADLFCPLHPESPEFASLSGMGFKACKKRHIPHEAARTHHVRSSHKRAWDAIERARAERQRAEDRELQLATIASNTRLMEAVLANAAGGGAKVEVKHNHGAPWNVKVEGCPRCEAE